MDSGADNFEFFWEQFKGQVRTAQADKLSIGVGGEGHIQRFDRNGFRAFHLDFRKRGLCPFDEVRDHLQNTTLGCGFSDAQIKETIIGLTFGSHLKPPPMRLPFMTEIISDTCLMVSWSSKIISTCGGL